MEITTLEIILLFFMVIATIIIIYKDKKQTKKNIYAYVLELKEIDNNRETIVFKLMTHFKLTFEDAHKIINEVELSGLTKDKT